MSTTHRADDNSSRMAAEQTARKAAEEAAKRAAQEAARKAAEAAQRAKGPAQNQNTNAATVRNALVNTDSFQSSSPAANWLRNNDPGTLIQSGLDALKSVATQVAKLGEAIGVAGTQAVSTAKTDAEIATQVASEVRELSANGADAAEIMAFTYERSVELVRERYPDMPVTERMDRAVAISFYTLNGPDQIGNLRHADSGETQVLQVLDELAAEAPPEAYAGGGLDSTNGRGSLYPDYSDGTNNQAFHTNFFVAAGYVAGDNVVSNAVAGAGNLFHETLDPDAWANGGGSMADYAASSAGLWAGQELFLARGVGEKYEAGEISHGANVDFTMPTLVAGIVSERGTPAPVVEGMNQAQIDESNRVMGVLADHREGIFRNIVENNWLAGAMIGFFHIPAALNGK